MRLGKAGSGRSRRERESGIPTFRGVNGLLRNYRIEEVAPSIAGERNVNESLSLLEERSAVRFVLLASLVQERC